MANTVSPTLLRSQPGVKRDGTRLDGQFYGDAQWCRFSRGLPRKMKGYRVVTPTLPEISRGMSAYGLNGQQILHSGGSQFFYQFLVNPQGIFQNQANRTPAAPFVASGANLWQTAIMQDSISTHLSIIAHPGQNLIDIDSNATSSLFIGTLNATSVLTDANAGGLVSPESGGICSVGPYLFKFGSSGHIAWSVPNKPTDFNNTGSGDAYVSPGGYKIVRGMSLRGAGGPSALFWSLGELLRATVTGGAVTWAFDTIAETTVLSSSGMVEFDSLYYWVGIDRFYVFNGVQQELQNPMNQDWFFDNLNFAYRQKVFAFKVPRRGEIWWCFPFGNSTECNAAVIYNVREKCWYDTRLPNSGRSAAVSAITYTSPFMGGVNLIGGTGYNLWQHETGYDEVVGTQVNAILSYFETHEYSMLTSQSPSSSTLRTVRIEPDFDQLGAMTVQMIGRANACAPEQVGDPFVFNPGPNSTSQEQTVPLKALARLMAFKFISNTAGGDYYLGATYVHIGPSDERVDQ